MGNRRWEGIRFTVILECSSLLVRRSPAHNAVLYRYDQNWNALVPVGRQPGSSFAQTQLSPESGDAPKMLRLDPSYLAASAERICQAIWERLNIAGPHYGTVYITLLQPTDPPQDILVKHMQNGRSRVWDYKLEIPENVSAEHVLRALTHVILQEAANRHPVKKLVEVPYWFREGMVEHLQATVADSAFFEQEEKVSLVVQMNEELPNLKREIDGDSLFSLEQISWPGTLKPGAETERAYRLTSHGLIGELLRLPNGGISLGNMLHLLVGYENWQFAFLHAFQGQFATLSDFEKWWAVTSLDLSSGETGRRKRNDDELLFRTELDIGRWERVITSYLGDRNANQEWLLADCFYRLEDILMVPVEWDAGEDGEITREEIPLRDIINSMEFSLQVPVIEQRVARLFGLQLHAPEDFVGLVRDYRLALEKYLVDREASYVVNTFKNQSAMSTVVVTRKALEKLDELDVQREEVGESLIDSTDSDPEQIADSRL